MSIHVSTWVQNCSDAELGDRLVLLILADNADSETWQAWPSVENIARRTRLSERQVQRCLKSLKEAGSIYVKQGNGRGHSNVYTIRSDAPDRLVMAKGCQDVTVSVPAKGDICDTERVTSATVKGDIFVDSGGPLLNEPSVNHQKEPSGAPLPPIRKFANEPPRPVQESHEPNCPNRGQPAATGDDPGQNGAGLRGSHKGRDESGLITRARNLSPCPGLGRELAKGETPCPDLTPMQQYEARLQLADERKAAKLAGKGRYNRRYPPQSRGKVERNGGGMPVTTIREPTSLLEAPSPLEAQMRHWAFEARCSTAGNGVADWIWDVLGAAKLQDAAGFEHRVRAKFAAARDAGLGWGAALQALVAEERNRTVKSKRESAEDRAVGMLLTREELAARRAAR